MWCVLLVDRDEPHRGSRGQEQHAVGVVGRCERKPGEEHCQETCERGHRDRAPMTDRSEIERGHPSTLDPRPRDPAVTNATRSTTGVRYPKRPRNTTSTAVPVGWMGSLSATSITAAWVHTTQPSGDGELSASSGNDQAVYQGNAYCAPAVYAEVVAPTVSRAGPARAARQPRARARVATTTTDA